MEIKYLSQRSAPPGPRRGKKFMSEIYVINAFNFLLLFAASLALRIITFVVIIKKPIKNKFPPPPPPHNFRL